MKQRCGRDTIAYLPAVLLAFILVLLGTFPAGAADFVDTKTSGYRMEISQLEAMDILQGYPDGRFYPEQPVSRAEFAKMLIAAAREQKDAAALAGITSLNYDDVDTDFWAKGYIVAGVEKGWLTIQGSLFGPDAYLTRQEAAVILSQVLQSGQGSQSGSAKAEVKFTDSKTIDGEAVAGVQQAVQEGLLTKFPDGSFRPLARLSRGEAAHVLALLMDRAGTLFDFSGILKKVGANALTAEVSGLDRTFKLASDAQIFDRNNLVTELSDLLPGRINFNVNDKGRIVFARYSYEDEYADVNTTQLELSAPQEESVSTQPDDAQAPEAAEIMANGKQDSEPNGTNLQTKPSLSLAIAQQEAGIRQMQTETGTSGQGVTIAIIDSGIDPLQPDLQRTDDGRRKVVDWVNYSAEGRVETKQLADENGSYIITSAGTYTLPGTAKSQSGQYHYGFWPEAWVTYSHDYDFTGNGSRSDQIMVLVVDSQTAGVYDEVFVDTNQNFSLTDEVPLKIYRDNKNSYASFPKTGDLPQGFPFVLCDIWDGGNMISFGYDSEGHGTHVAGIAAANGALRGAAPNAQLMAIKVADSAGVAYLENTLKAVEYAVKKGANIINVSLGYYEKDPATVKKFRDRIGELANHTLICVSVGNDGPGLSTLAAPADVSQVLSVGGYSTPSMWSADYGWKIPSAGLWYFSSAGPAADGGMKPDLLAPGAVISTVPAWTGQTSQLIEGSSMASPFAAGAAALLMEDMWKKGHGFNSLMIKQALVNGARPLEDLSMAEQGCGALDAYAADQLILKEKVLPADDNVEVSSDLSGAGRGLFIRDEIPGGANYNIYNHDGEALIQWQSGADWLQLKNSPIYLPADGQRNLRVEYALPSQPGLYTALITGTFADSNRIPLEIFNTVVVPEQWSKNGEINLYQDLTAGQMKRFYIRVPEDEKSLTLNLKVLGSLNQLQGRVRMHIFDAAGKLYDVTEFAGRAPKGMTARREISEEIDSPMAGIWEIVIYSSSTLSDYGLTTSNYVLNAQLDHFAETAKKAESEFIIGAAVPRGTDAQADIHLTILKAKDYLPYSGPLLINGRLYHVDQGKVTVTADVQHEKVNITVQRP